MDYFTVPLSPTFCVHDGGKQVFNLIRANINRKDHSFDLSVILGCRIIL
jgi:hypothetical protein